MSERMLLRCDSASRCSVSRSGPSDAATPGRAMSPPSRRSSRKTCCGWAAAAAPLSPWAPTAADRLGMTTDARCSRRRSPTRASAGAAPASYSAQAVAQVASDSPPTRRGSQYPLAKGANASSRRSTRTSSGPSRRRISWWASSICRMASQRPPKAPTADTSYAAPSQGCALVCSQMPCVRSLTALSQRALRRIAKRSSESTRARFARGGHTPPASLPRVYAAKASPTQPSRCAMRRCGYACSPSPHSASSASRVASRSSKTPS
mmetsp:Transcript_11055/g.45898  ORF Transcript_11055/g.45898 Transcript_11055/m.45898 type:complete len:264 (-) Transcript_11055:168-959(-)